MPQELTEAPAVGPRWSADGKYLVNSIDVLGEVDCRTYRSSRRWAATVYFDTEAEAHAAVDSLAHDALKSHVQP